MKSHLFLTLVFFVLAACGSTTNEPSVSPVTPPIRALEVHEWGVLAVSAGGIEVAAGPGRQPQPQDFGEIFVEKPVLYLHANAASSVDINVVLGAGYSLAERWPGSGMPLSWHAEVSPTPCTGVVNYPSDCTSVDGYCETRELRDYEASSASCLQVGADKAPLLFYRLRAELGTELPVVVQDKSARANFERIGWVIRREGNRASARRVTIGSNEQNIAVANEGLPVQAAMTWMSEKLAEHGLDDQERGAFERAWYEEFFGRTAQEHLGAETPDAVEDAVEEATRQAQEMLARATSREYLLYFMTAEEIDAVARLEIAPAARAVRRAFVVRHQL